MKIFRRAVPHAYEAQENIEGTGMNPTVLKLTLHPDRNVTGPLIHIPADRVMAVAERYAPDLNSGQEMRWASTVYLIGGEHVPVCESPEEIFKAMYG